MAFMGNATIERLTGRAARRVDRPLDVDLWDARMRAIGYTTVPAQAEAVRAAERTMHRIRTGECMPRLDLAFRMEEVADAPLKVLFPAQQRRRRAAA